MGKRSKDKGSKKERRRAEAAAQAEAAALARSTWLAQSLGRDRTPEDGAAERAAREHRSRDTTSGAAVAVPGSSRAGESGDPHGPMLPDGPDVQGDVPTRVDSPAARDAAPRPGHPEGALRGEPATTSPGALRPPVDATELAARLAGLSTVLQRELGRADVGDGLTRARLSALSLLVLGGPRTLGDLATAEHVRPPTMTRLVHAMEADGLVARERHPSDGRSIVLRATVRGEALLEQGRARQVTSLARAFERLDAAERARLADAADLLGRVLRTSDRGVGDASA